MFNKPVLSITNHHDQLSIRWNKLQSLLVTTVMNDSFQFTTCQYKCNLLWLPLSFLIYNIGNSKLAFR